jgi:hypothetical protein
MTETYNSDTEAALSASVYREILFLKIEFPGYTFRACNLTHDYTLDGETYIGCAPIASISAISESADITAEPVQFSLSGLDSSLISELVDFEHQGSAVTLSVGFFDESDTLIPDPVTVFVGVVDTMSLSIGSTLTVTITADSYLRLLFRGPDGHRRMQSDQELIFSGDLGLEFAASLSNTVPWGVPSPTPASQSNGGARSSAFGRVRP